MALAEFLLMILIAGFVGALGQALAGYTLGGCVVSIAVGFVGAVLGTWMAGALGLPDLVTLQIGGRPFPIIWSILGSALFVAVLGLLARRRHGRTNL